MNGWTSSAWIEHLPAGRASCYIRAMSAPDPTDQGPAEAPPAPVPVAAGIPRQTALALVVALQALWYLFSAAVLWFFHGSAADALAGGMKDAAGQRLLGAYLFPLGLALGVGALRRVRGLMLLAPTLAYVVLGVSVGEVVTHERSFSSSAVLIASSAAFALLFTAFALVRTPPASAGAGSASGGLAADPREPSDDLPGRQTGRR